MYLTSIPNQRRQVFTTLIKKGGETVQLVHSMAPALTLTLTLNHLANKPQQTTSTAYAVEHMRKEPVQSKLNFEPRHTKWSWINLATFSLHL